MFTIAQIHMQIHMGRFKTRVCVKIGAEIYIGNLGLGYTKV